MNTREAVKGALPTGRVHSFAFVPLVLSISNIFTERVVAYALLILAFLSLVIWITLGVQRIDPRRARE